MNIKRDNTYINQGNNPACLIEVHNHQMRRIEMGTISVNKLAGYSMMVGPTLALVCYFITPGGMFIDTANPAAANEVVAALQGNSTLAAITGILVPVGLIVFFSGLSQFVANMSGGSGHAIARLGTPLVLISIIGWVIGSGITIGISNGAALGEAAFYPIQVGITAVSTLGTILFGVGAMLIACAASKRDENNTYMAYVASLAGIVAAVTGVIGGISSGQLELMTMIGGICFLVFTIWSIIVGLAMSSSD
jgi:hypothetical protein